MYTIFFCIIMKFNLAQINLGKFMYFNETIVKIVLILLDSLHSHCTDVKTCFLILWFNCEFRIKTDNKKYKQNAPMIHDIWFSKTKLHVYFSKEGKELM